MSVPAEEDIRHADLTRIREWFDHLDDYEPLDRGRVFEFGLVRMFELDGAIHLPPAPSGSLGGPLSVLCEAKAHARPLNVEPVAKLRNQLQRRPAGLVGALFSLSGFSPAALELTKYLAPVCILLWDRSHVLWSLEQPGRAREALLRKYRHALEQNIEPNFDPFQQ
jgi:hypothetical protein